MPYEELTPAEFFERLAVAPIAHPPFGTLEWHGAHLPPGSRRARLDPDAVSQADGAQADADSGDGTAGAESVS